MAESMYYDGTKLLSLLDLDGQKPEIYMCTTNRSAGKTTYFSRLLVNRFLDSGEKFGLIYRYNYELDDCADKFFKDIGSLFFSSHAMINRRKAGGMFHELVLDDKPCGYAISLNSADQLKKYSHLFSDICAMMFDEFQSESNHYCPDEIRKLLSVHTTVARGQGKLVRYVPVYMCGNPVSLINPYYVELGITERLRADTKYLRGHGFVLEQGFLESASIAQMDSGFNRAFARNTYVQYASQSVYLNDNTAFIDRPSGASKYLATLRYENVDYGIRSFDVQSIVYCDDKPDTSYPFKLTVTTDDHNINYVMLRRNDLFLAQLRYFFENGCFRFKNLKCKEAVLRALSY